jgi:hypothetical protein
VTAVEISFSKSPCLTNHKAFTLILSYEHRYKPSTGHWPQGLTEFDLSIELAGCRTASGNLELDGAVVVGVGILAAVFRIHLTRQMVVQADAHRTVLSKDGGPFGGLPFPAAKPEPAFSLTQTVGEP